MEWNRFNTHGESENHAFEVMCNILFEKWCKREYADEIKSFFFVNGIGGDGGVEAYCELKNNSIIAVQSKWFPQTLDKGQFSQIYNSFSTALKVRPNIVKYIVCLPRDLSSQRIASGGKKTVNSENDKWNELLRRCHELHSEVDVILWSDSVILSELQRPESAGSSKYWFDNTEITDDTFEIAINKVKNSWARLKYIPDLYSTGHVHDVLIEHLNDTGNVVKKINSITITLNALHKLTKSLNDIKQFIKSKELLVDIDEDIIATENLLIRLETAQDIISSGSEYYDDSDNRYELKCSVERLKDEPYSFSKYFHFHAVEQSLEEVKECVYECLNSINKATANTLILLGNPGTGKTAGIVNESLRYFENRRHLPLLISAKRIEGNKSWKDIIVDYLGISSRWDERELFTALSTAALLRYRTISSEESIIIRPKLFICIDGIDESKYREYWLTKIHEAKSYESIYPDIKFVFLSRHTLFKIYEERKALLNNVSYLPTQSDADIDNLLDKYTGHYKIDINSHQWIRNIIKTPLSVKLFCDLFKGRSLEQTSEHHLIITSLIKKKIDEMDHAFLNEVGAIIEKKPITKVLRNISQLFVDDEKIDYDVIVSIIPSSINRFSNEILLFLENEGIIDIRSDDDKSEPVIYWGMQPTLDYLIAESIFEKIDRGEKITSIFRFGVYQMLSILIIENKEKLISQMDCFDDDIDYFELDCFALTNATPEKAAIFYDALKRTIRESRNNFREITNKVIIPLSRDSEHPLGSKLLDDFLSGFIKPADRDTWWSIPAYLRYDKECDWISYTEFNFDEVKLEPNYPWYGRPLMVAWMLSNVNTYIRQESAQKLLLWSISSEQQYIELLKHFENENDQQILEELYAIAYGLSLRHETSDNYLQNIAEFVLDSLFSVTGLEKNQNTALRYYGRGIVEIAIARKVIDSSFESAVAPPYHYETKKMSIVDDEDVLSRNRMGGFGPIDYDLARYVLCDRLDSFFGEIRSTKEKSTEATRFIETYSEHYLDKAFKIDGFIISMAYQYVLEKGWSCNEFVGKGKFDSLILGTYYPATHGSRSRIMCIGEKYVWLAKHNIEAVFANEMPMVRYDEVSFVEDYGDLDNYSNPYQDLVDNLQVDCDAEWIHMDELANPLENGYSKESIEKWMIDEKCPDFQKWLFDNEEKILISSSTTAINEEYGLEETIWISTGICSSSDFEDFIDCLADYSPYRNELINVSDFHSYIDTHCYCSPQEVCLIESKKEVENTLIFECGNKKIEIIKLVSDCLSANSREVERVYTIPNKTLRKMLCVEYGDGYHYYNKNNEEVCCFTYLGENWKTNQNCLMVNNKLFFESTQKHDFTAFWLFRVYRSPDVKARETFNGIMHSTDRTYIAWKNKNGEFLYKKLEEIEPPRTKNDLLKGYLPVFENDFED